ncbi:MAG: GNAT family N-acetyltransferase [Bryobacter sp.]|nr:GNAT family N-acetyltransferase [Bryobacter sp.]
MTGDPVAGPSRSARQLAEALQILIATVPGAEVHSADGLRTAYAGAASPFFNYFFLERPCSPWEFRAHLSTIRTLTDGRDPRWLIVGPGEAFGPEHREALAARQIEELFQAQAMSASQLASPTEELPALEFNARWGRKEVDEFTALNMEANAMPVEEGQASVTSYFLLDPRCCPVVGYQGGEAVSAAVAILLADCIYLAWIATAPAYQGLGFGEAVVREAVRRAKEASGHEAVVLHSAEPEGGLWRRLGLTALPGEFCGFGHGF